MGLVLHLWHVNLDREATVIACFNLGIVDPVSERTSIRSDKKYQYYN
jgi:hypothetical protein